jgi:hypothetical protein
MSVRVDPEVLRNEAAIRGLSMRDLGKKAGLSDATMSNAAAGAALRSPRSIGAGAGSPRAGFSGYTPDEQGRPSDRSVP